MWSWSSGIFNLAASVYRTICTQDSNSRLQSHWSGRRDYQISLYRERASPIPCEDQQHPNLCNNHPPDMQKNTSCNSLRQEAPQGPEPAHCLAAAASIWPNTQDPGSSHWAPLCLCFPKLANAFPGHKYLGSFLELRKRKVWRNSS